LRRLEVKEMTGLKDYKKETMYDCTGKAIGTAYVVRTPEELKRMNDKLLNDYIEEKLDEWPVGNKIRDGCYDTIMAIRDFVAKYYNVPASGACGIFGGVPEKPCAGMVLEDIRDKPEDFPMAMVALAELEFQLVRVCDGNQNELTQFWDTIYSRRDGRFGE
jgi:hypothetical protein